MKILLDTHVLIWALTNSPMLSSKARSMILQEDNEIYFSVVSLWEIELKHITKPEKLPITARSIFEFCSESGYKLVHLKENSIFKLSELNRSESAPPHKDPFDRILLCQSIAEDMLFLTHDVKIADYNLKNIVTV
ncbi:MAG: type II toxin-antitoxin system VapC family toxin [Oscillospiraceae bacterium]|nr:type II toxin-antitoxin system VapC family toxin [Oscillospiraceae bacterium]